MVSGNSPYDRLVYKDERTAIDASTWRGMRLFFSDQTKCARCHQGFNFSGPVNYAGVIEVKPGFHNTDGKGGYPVSDCGLFDLTAEANDMGKFRAPTLRNIEFTAPYMHDGSIDTLAAVIDHYAQGGRSRNPFQDPLISGFEISEQDLQDLVNFLKSLSGKSYVINPLFSDPFQ